MILESSIISRRLYSAVIYETDFTNKHTIHSLLYVNSIIKEKKGELFMKPIVIGCDNAAVELKNQIIALLIKKEIPYEDVGVNSTADEEMYPAVAGKVAHKIIESDYKKEGILVCGTGIGMAIAANKYPGIYAAVCHDIFSAERARLSNDTNVLTMGARVLAPQLALKLVETWLDLEFVPGNSTPKVEKIKDIEKENFKLIS